MSMPGKTRAHGARVRRVGPRSGWESRPESWLLPWRFGSVKAQFSQGPARRVTCSSYVLRKSWRDGWPECDGRGLSGGVSTAEPRAAVCADRRRDVRYVWASFSDTEAEALLRDPASSALRSASVIAAVCEGSRVCKALVCGRSGRVGELRRSCSKHAAQATGMPSVTIKGVGPWSSQ